jgi:dihydrofolate reductase
MRRLAVFNSITLDGYFTGRNGDLAWAHRDAEDPEFNAFVAENAKGGGQLLFGRKTYEMMVGYWPTPQAMRDNPDVAREMNQLPKVVFSRTLPKAEWSNTTLVKTDPVEAVRQLKRESGPEMVIMGSGTIVSLLARAGLIDEYQVVVVPVVLGVGRTMFEGLEADRALTLTRSRVFPRGRVFLSYEPKR